jgi:pimeloyl-ACP methyl ester carboxylesterase
MDQPDDGIVGALEAMKRRPDSTGDLPGIRLPTVIVVGELDPITPPRVAEAMQAAIPGARLVVLPGAGHLVNLEAADAFHRALDFSSQAGGEQA